MLFANVEQRLPAALAVAICPSLAPRRAASYLSGTVKRHFQGHGVKDGSSPGRMLALESAMSRCAISEYQFTLYFSHTISLCSILYVFCQARN